MSHLAPSSSSLRTAGFSLVEILLVILIILMLAGALIVYVLPQQEDAQIGTTKLKLQNLKTGLELYKLHMGTFPRSEHGGLKALLEPPNKWRGPYVDFTTVFDDAWGNDLKYKLVDANRRGNKSAPPYLLYSVGPDARENTPDDIYLVKPKSDGLDPNGGRGGNTGALDSVGGTPGLPVTGPGAGTGGTTVPTPTPPGS